MELHGAVCCVVSGVVERALERDILPPSGDLILDKLMSPSQTSTWFLSEMAIIRPTAQGWQKCTCTCRRLKVKGFCCFIIIVRAAWTLSD